ncbi:MAG: hypothetical protein Kow00127_14530 [Bacteroidales bacterium]
MRFSRLNRIAVVFFIVFQGIAFTLHAQDTLVVQTFTFDSTSRAGVFSFPDAQPDSWSKILLQYTMRCHDAAVGNGNVGCYEWDYHCNTVVTDSSLTDSVRATHPDYIITGTSSNPFYYVNSQTYNYLLFTQQQVLYNTINWADTSFVGNGLTNIDEPFGTGAVARKSRLLYTAGELSAAGFSAGEITGLAFQIADAGVPVRFLKVRMKQTGLETLDPVTPDNTGFEEVYFLDTPFGNAGWYGLHFYNPFEWDGVQNIVVELSYTLEEPGDPTILQGESVTGDMMLSSATPDGYVRVSEGDYIDVPAGAFGSLDSVITIAFWQYGDPEKQPFNSWILEGADASGQRVVNIHLPWGNSRVYWDAGNSGTGSYDRIDKQASFDEFAGRWNHWAFIKNAATGEMKIYLNGELWHSGTGKTRTMEGISVFHLAGSKTAGKYAGMINDFSVWDTELDQQTIAQWMYRDITSGHPAWDHLLLYYRLDEADNGLVTDFAPGGYGGTVVGQPLFRYKMGHELDRNFEAFDYRPNTAFIRGDYVQSVDTINFLDSVPRPYNIIYSYYVTGTNLYPGDTSVAWEAGYMPVVNEQGATVDSVFVPWEGSIEINTLEYYPKWPMRFELLSFITPYGNGLDLGQDGVMWEFDVTDFAPVLRGDKYLSIEGVGKWSEELDLKFLYISGTPVRDVLSVQQLWPVTPASQLWSGFSPADIINDVRFEPREITIPSDADAVKLRSAITGHGQTGEFTPKWHWLDIDGGTHEFTYKVWKECSTIPVYPQGGTWLFDRAGWCPGDPTKLFEFDATPYVTSGQTHTIDYGLQATVPFSNADYRISNQMVCYGPPNFSLDAEILGVVKPNSAYAAHLRFNPACMAPEVWFRNNGTEAVQSLEIEYGVEGGAVEVYTWTGNLGFLDSVLVELPIPSMAFWEGTAQRFHVNILSVNGTSDEVAYNNHYVVPFGLTDVFDVSVEMELHCYTNNYGFQNSYYVMNSAGEIILERDNLESNTLYVDALDLEPGCYKIHIDDTGDNGLYYWYNTSQGSGYLRLKKPPAYILKHIEPEFGRFAEYEFAVANLTGVERVTENRTMGIYPNPAKDHLFIELTGFPAGTQVGVSLNSLDGRELIQKQFTSSDDFIREYIALDGLAGGVYIVRCQAGEKTLYRKIIIGN